MGSGVLKTIVVVILLAALAFVAGSMAADGVKQAMVPVLLVLGGVVLLCMGRHCWILGFILPTMLYALGVGDDKIPLAHFVCVALLAYWLIMSIMGYVKMTWNSVPVIDCAVVLFTVYFLSTWFANPVTINTLVNHITDSGYAQVGGAEYVWCITAFMTFVFFSILPLNMDKLGRMLKLVVYFSLLMSAVSAVKIALSPQVNEFGETVAIGEAIQGGRLKGFAQIGNALFFFLFCKYSILGIICSPWKLALAMAGVVGMVISGFRSVILTAALNCLLVQMYQRRLLSLLFCGACVYGGAYILSSSFSTNQLPYGLKRIFSSIPGLGVKDRKIEAEAQHSLDWRYEMWEWAMNPSKGYIKDYVWGDGFGLDAQEMRLERININRRKIDEGSNVLFARRGVWHSGWVTAIHRLGYVGLAVTIIFQLIICVYAMRFCSYARKLPNSEFYYYMFIPIVVSSVMFHYSAGTYISFFSMFHKYAMLKLAYSLAIKEGYMSPMFRKQKYVPMMLQEVEVSQQRNVEDTEVATA